MANKQQTSLKLNNGHLMPLVGLGTLRGSADEIRNAVKDAIDIGYRHIDTAFAYFNEKEIGEAVREKITDGTIKREDIFITTKMPNHYMTPEKVPEALEKSLRALDLGYIDLYLIHGPVGMHYKDEQTIFPVDESGRVMTHQVDHLALWREMEKAVESGKVKSIGISNFNKRQIQNILDHCKIKPANFQVECHVYNQQRKLADFCQKNGISVAAYGPLGSPGVAPPPKKGEEALEPILQNRYVLSLAKKYNKSPAQVLLRWLIQRNIIVLPKSTNKGRLQENFNVFDFELNNEEMKGFEALDHQLRIYQVANVPGMTEAHEYPWHDEY